MVSSSNETGPTEKGQLFNVGTIVTTQNFQDKVKLPSVEVMKAVSQHATGNWGLVDEEDWATNDFASRNGGRVMSVYKSIFNDTTYWVITEADRSVTTLLLPEDYW